MSVFVWQGKVLFLSPLNFSGHPMITQSIESHSSTFSHRSWGDNLQWQESTEVWPGQLLNDGEAQNYLPSSWGNGSEQTERSWGSADVTAQEAPPVLTSYLSLAQSSQCSLLGNSLLRWRNLFLMANWGEIELCLMALQILKATNWFVIRDDALGFLCLEGAKGESTSVTCSNHLGECCF